MGRIGGMGSSESDSTRTGTVSEYCVGMRQADSAFLVVFRTPHERIGIRVRSHNVENKDDRKALRHGPRVKQNQIEALIG